MAVQAFQLDKKVEFKKYNALSQELYFVQYATL